VRTWTILGFAALSALGCGDDAERGRDAGARVGTDAGATDAGPSPAVDAGARDSGSCAPICGGRSCGDDGCGGVCGICGEGERCTEGACEREPPDGVECDRARCAAGQACCWDPAGARTCVASEGECGLYPYSCDGHDDCAAGERCCVELRGPAGFHASCRPSGECATPLCSGPADCDPVRERCCSSILFPLDRCMTGVRCP
jgi:hypothetical protein